MPRAYGGAREALAAARPAGPVLLASGAEAQQPGLLGVERQPVLPKPLEFWTSTSSTQPMLSAAWDEGRRAISLGLASASSAS